MIIRITSARSVLLEDAANFRKFHVEVEAPETKFAEIASANTTFVRFDDAKTAWVAIDALKAVDSVKSDAGWQQQFEAMIEKARPHGWISPDGKAIKAHIVWAG